MLKQLVARLCPCCSHEVLFSHRLLFLIREPVTCRYCTKTLRPDIRTMSFNMFWLSMTVAWMVLRYTSLTDIFAFMVAVCSANLLLPAFDLLFPLEESINSPE